MSARKTADWFGCGWTTCHCLLGSREDPFCLALMASSLLCRCHRDSGAAGVSGHWGAVPASPPALEIGDKTKSDPEQGREDSATANVMT